MTTEVPVHGWT